MLSNEYGTYTNVSLTILLPLPSSDVASSGRLSESSTVFFHEFLRPRFWICHSSFPHFLHVLNMICMRCTTRALYSFVFVMTGTIMSIDSVSLCSYSCDKVGGLKDERCRRHTPISSELGCSSRTRVWSRGWKCSSHGFSKFVGFWT
jgi:hypothetical protein